MLRCEDVEVTSGTLWMLRCEDVEVTSGTLWMLRCEDVEVTSGTLWMLRCEDVEVTSGTLWMLRCEDVEVTSGTLWMLRCEDVEVTSETLWMLRCEDVEVTSGTLWMLRCEDVEVTSGIVQHQWNTNNRFRLEKFEDLASKGSQQKRQGRRWWCDPLNEDGAKGLAVALAPHALARQQLREFGHNLQAVCWLKVVFGVEKNALAHLQPQFQWNLHDGTSKTTRRPAARLPYSYIYIVIYIYNYIQ